MFVFRLAYTLTYTVCPQTCTRLIVPTDVAHQCIPWRVPAVVSPLTCPLRIPSHVSILTRPFLSAGQIPHHKDLPHASGELIARLYSEVKSMKSKQDSLDSHLNKMKRENESLWREVLVLRQKHAKQQQIVNKVSSGRYRLVMSWCPWHFSWCAAVTLYAARPCHLAYRSPPRRSSTSVSWRGRIKARFARSTDLRPARVFGRIHTAGEITFRPSPMSVY